MCPILKMQVALFAEMLADAITQFRILAECHNEQRTYKEEQDLTLLVGNKDNVEPAKGKTELCDITSKQLYCDAYKIKKNISDRMLCYKVFSDIYSELALNGTFSSLIKFNHSVQNKSDEARNKIIYRETVKKLRLQRNRMKSALYDITTATHRLFVEPKDTQIKKMVQERYVDHWHESRAEQNLVRIKRIEGEHSDVILNYHKKHEEEQRIHSDIELLNNVQVNETLKRIDEIMLKYETDIEAMEVRIERMHSNYEDQKIKRQELKQKVADRETTIRNWLQFKKDRERTRLRNLKLNQAAIIVQAWWRGLLVRLELGPYKKKKNSKKKK